MHTGICLWAFEHTDNCIDCSQGRFCDEGRKRLHYAAEKMAEMIVPGVPLSEKPEAKA